MVVVITWGNKAVYELLSRFCLAGSARQNLEEAVVTLNSLFLVNVGYVALGCLLNNDLDGFEKHRNAW